VASEVRAFFRNGGKGDYFVDCFSLVRSRRDSAEWLGPHGLLSGFCGRERHSGRATFRHDWRESSSKRHHVPGPMIVFNTAVDYKIKGKIWP